MAWTFTDEEAGLQPIATTDTVQNHPLGYLRRAKDPLYGEGTFIYLKGVASTAVGDVVNYDTYNGTTTRAVAATRGPLAVAMSANVASQFGWYQVHGAAVTSTAAGTIAGNTFMVTATAGQISNGVTAAQGVIGARALTAVGTPSAGLAVVQLHFPGAYHTTNV